MSLIISCRGEYRQQFHTIDMDVLVNNAGYGLFSPIEDVTLDQVKKQFETNFFGIVRLPKEVLPIMRKQRSRMIVNLSSIFGRVGTQPCVCR